MSDVFDTIIIMKRGLCMNCVHYEKYEDDTFKCSFYPSDPRKTEMDDYCKIDNITKFGYKEEL